MKQGQPISRQISMAEKIRPRGFAVSDEHSQNLIRQMSAQGEKTIERISTFAPLHRRRHYKGVSDVTLR